MRAFASLCLFAFAAAAAARELPPDVTLLRGAFGPGQPDGNSTLLAAPDGVIAIDTGRHASHTQRVLDAAHEHGQPIVAVINTHWHLDHIGGNARVRAAFPGVPIYASDAFSAARSGFLAHYRRQLEDAIAHAGADTDTQAWRDEIALLDHAAELAPDHVVERTQTLRIGGRALELHLETHSVTAGDVWLFDPADKLLVAGDLVTLPAPLFDTACPKRWQAALGHLAQAKFMSVIPGHGAPLDRAQFATYRRAFEHLVACGAGKAPKASCIDGWLHDAQDLIAADERDLARRLLDYYLDNSLRAPADKSAALCGA